MKLINEFRPMIPVIIAGPSKQEIEDFTKMRDKILEGMKQTWDYNSESGLKEIWESKTKAVLIRIVYGTNTFYEIDKSEIPSIIDEDWTKVKNGK